MIEDNMDTVKEKVSVLLKPKANVKKFLFTLSEIKGFKLERVIDMKTEGSVVIGFCDKATQRTIMNLPHVEDIEKSGTVSICFESNKS